MFGLEYPLRKQLLFLPDVSGFDANIVVDLAKDFRPLCDV